MKLKFLLDRLLGNERGLQAYSRPEPEVLGLLAGRSVALVGNARALSEGSCGAQIEACDIVFRLKRAPIPSPVSHGVRTDWLATSMPITPELLGLDQPGWSLMPMPGTTALFDSGAMAEAHLAEAAGLRPEFLGLTEDGFRRYRLHL